MADNNTNTICVNGELRPGDLVISIPEDEYGCLVGTVLYINKLGTPEHDAETTNDTDDVHVNFMGEDYSDQRIREIDSMLDDLYGESKSFLMAPLDDTIMSPDMLIRITGIGREELADILDSEAKATTFCERVIQALETQEIIPETPAQAVLHEPDASDSEEVAALRERLIERLDNNLTEYIYSLYEYCEVEVTGSSSEISAMAGAHYYLTERHNFHTSEAEYLLKFQNPLRVVADQFELESEIENHSAVMWDIFDKQDALRGDYELAAISVTTVENVRGHDEGEKPSVMEQIRRAREDAKANPAPRKESSGKDHGPEL